MKELTDAQKAKQNEAEMLMSIGIVYDAEKPRASIKDLISMFGVKHLAIGEQMVEDLSAMKKNIVLNLLSATRIKSGGYKIVFNNSLEIYIDSKVFSYLKKKYDVVKYSTRF